MRRSVLDQCLGATSTGAEAAGSRSYNFFMALGPAEARQTAASAV